MKTAKAPYDGNVLCRTILTKVKPHHYHPTGLRRFSIREYAALQTFPHHFLFAGGSAEALKQIGNAVPPTFAEKMYRHITMELRAADEAEEKERAASDQEIGPLRGRVEFIDLEAAEPAEDRVF